MLFVWMQSSYTAFTNTQFTAQNFLVESIYFIVGSLAYLAISQIVSFYFLLSLVLGIGLIREAFKEMVTDSTPQTVSKKSFFTSIYPWFALFLPFIITAVKSYRDAGQSSGKNFFPILLYIGFVVIETPLALFSYLSKNKNIYTTINIIMSVLAFFLTIFFLVGN